MRILGLMLLEDAKLERRILDIEAQYIEGWLAYVRPSNTTMECCIETDAASPLLLCIPCHKYAPKNTNLLDAVDA